MKTHKKAPIDGHQTKGADFWKALSTRTISTPYKTSPSGKKTTSKPHKTSISNKKHDPKPFSRVPTLELRNTTLRVRLNHSTTSTAQDVTTQTITSGLHKSKSMRDKKQGVSTDRNNINVTQPEEENVNYGITLKRSQPIFRMENIKKQPRPKRTGRNIRSHPCNYKCLNKRWTPKPRKEEPGM